MKKSLHKVRPGGVYICEDVPDADFDRWKLCLCDLAEKHPDKCFELVKINNPRNEWNSIILVSWGHGSDQKIMCNMILKREPIENFTKPMRCLNSIPTLEWWMKTPSFSTSWPTRPAIRFPGCTIGTRTISISKSLIFSIESSHCSCSGGLWPPNGIFLNYWQNHWQQNHGVKNRNQMAWWMRGSRPYGAHRGAAIKTGLL